MTTEIRLVGGRSGVAERTGRPGLSDQIFADLDLVLWEWDVANDRLSWTVGAERILGTSPGDDLRSGAGYRRLVSARSPQTRDEILASASAQEASTGWRHFALRYELSLAGRIVAVEDAGKVFFGAGRKVERASGALRLLRDGEKDALDGTGLATAARTELMGWIADALGRAKAEGSAVGLLVFSISGFSTIEEHNGSEVAEEVALAVLSRLRSELRRTDKVIRYATNRFATLLRRADAATTEASARRLAASIARDAVQTDTGLVPVKVTAGAILGPAFAREARTLLRRAEEAMGKARHDGETVVLYEPDRKGEAARLKSLALSDEVMRALDADRLMIARQPVVDSVSRKTIFEEALLRLVREDGSVVGAGAVVHIFEQLGRIEMLDLRVLDLVVAALRAEPATSLSVNVSAATLRAGAWMKRLFGHLAATPEIAKRLIVEMTETQAIDDEEMTKRSFAEIRALGALTAIDDFGAGNTSFRHLKGLDVDVLKIDGGFVKNVGINAEDTFFVRTLVDLARHLGIRTVAEWVRDERAARLLTSYGVDYLQGDCLGPAVILAPLAGREIRGAA